VGLGGAEQHTIGDDDGGSAAGLEQAQEQRREQQLRLLGLDDLLQVLGGGLVVEAAGERGIGEDQRVAFGFTGGALGEGIAVANVWLIDAVQQHVHAGDAEHRAVEVEAVEHTVVEMTLLRSLQQLGVVFALYVLCGGDQESGGAAGRVADLIARAGVHHLDHELDDVPRRTKLAVLPSGGDLAEHVLVEVALDVALVERKFIKRVDGLGEKVRRRDGEPGVLHVL